MRCKDNAYFSFDQIFGSKSTQCFANYIVGAADEHDSRLLERSIERFADGGEDLSVEADSGCTSCKLLGRECSRCRGIAPIVIDGGTWGIASGKHTEYGLDVLVADHTEDDLQWMSCLMERHKLGAKVSKTAGIVPRIAEHAD